MYAPILMISVDLRANCQGLQLLETSHIHRLTRKSIIAAQNGMAYNLIEVIIYCQGTGMQWPDY